MPVIYHVTAESEWLKARQQGFYEAASLASEGFIHCSRPEQVDGVLERYFQGKKGLVKLVIDLAKLSSRLVFERSASAGELFPHIYGPLNPEAVIEVIPL